MDITNEKAKEIIGSIPFDVVEGYTGLEVTMAKFKAIYALEMMDRLYKTTHELFGGKEV